MGTFLSAFQFTHAEVVSHFIPGNAIVGILQGVTSILLVGIIWSWQWAILLYLQREGGSLDSQAKDFAKEAADQEKQLSKANAENKGKKAETKDEGGIDVQSKKAGDS